MDKFLLNTNVENDLPSRSECIEKRTEFFECVNTAKSELTKSLTSNEEWKNYRNQVNGISMTCFKKGDLKSCDRQFSFFDISY